MPKVSIILIAYNAQDFLYKALENLKNQTYHNIEIIMVDDGSSDRTGELLKSICLEDNRFKYYHKKNGGVASARNFGIKYASGDFIIHHDADDYIPVDAIELLIINQRINKTDIVISDYTIINKNFIKRVNQNFIGDWKEYLTALVNNKYHGALWNKLIRKELYKGIEFADNINYMEDKLFLIKILVEHKPTLSYVNFSTYNYVQITSSITNKLSDSALNNIKSVINEIEKLFDRNKIDIDLTYMKFHYKLIAVLNNKNIDFKHDFSEINTQIFKIGKAKFVHKIMVWSKIRELDLISNLILKLK